MDKVISKADFQNFFADLLGRFSIFGPTRKGGITSHAYLGFGPVSSLTELELDHCTGS
ncbi:MAG: hypothetical protein QXT45_06685 [Candidatus Bilamarchaeaceae archaeon]